jgi:hypothetical protein
VSSCTTLIEGECITMDYLTGPTPTLPTFTPPVAPEPVSTWAPVHHEPAPKKSRKGWWIGGSLLVLGIISALGSSSSSSDSTSYTPSTSGSSSSFDTSSYSSSSIERSFVVSSCETALDSVVSGGESLRTMLATGTVTRYQAAAAFASGYVPSSGSSSVLSTSEVISACVSGLGG